MFKSALLVLGMLGANQVHAAKIMFCVRSGDHENDGYGAFEKEKTKEKDIEDMTAEWDSAGKQVKRPGQKAHVHGVDGRLDSKCRLVHENGERKKLSLCSREKGSTKGFNKNRKNVEYFTDEIMATYANKDWAWAGEKVHINGNNVWLNDNCRGENERYKPSVYGDPHFATWGGSVFDFHGECDMVMVANPGFADGLGLRIHIRTKISTWWSHIESAVVQVGDNTIEVMGFAGNAGKYWINGQEGQELEDLQTTLGDFPLDIKKINDHQGRVRLDLFHGNGISFETYKRFVRVNIATLQPDRFDGSVGVLGSYGGDMLARDGQTIIEDPISFGQEWQVLLSEPMLFHKASAIQHPTKCAMPTAEKKESRRLGEGTITMEDAVLACQRVDEASRDACVFDVLATNDKDMAGAY